MTSLIYLQSMPFPTAQTHSIQITRTVAALGCEIDVLLAVGALTVEAAGVPEAVRRIYDVDFGPRVRVVAVPRWRLREPMFASPRGGLSSWRRTPARSTPAHSEWRVASCAGRRCTGSRSLFG